jgi:hypothetical protein
MSQQNVQEREKVLKECQQAVESLKVIIIIDQKRCTISLPSSSQVRAREREF